MTIIGDSGILLFVCFCSIKPQFVPLTLLKKKFISLLIFINKRVLLKLFNTWLRMNIVQVKMEEAKVRLIKSINLLCMFMWIRVWTLAEEVYRSFRYSCSFILHFCIFQLRNLGVYKGWGMTSLFNSFLLINNKAFRWWLILQFTIYKEVREKFTEHLWLDVVSKSDLLEKAPVVYATEDAHPAELELAKYRKSGPDGAIHVSVQTEQGLCEVRLCS